MVVWPVPGSRYYYDWYGSPPTTDAEHAPLDADVKHQVVEHLNQNELVRDAGITVTVEDGIVTLTGEVDSILVKRAAGDDAWDTAGVRDVHNELRIAPRA